MTPQERLKGIMGSQLGRACETDGRLPNSFYEMEWLIARVKQLESFIFCMRPAGPEPDESSDVFTKSSYWLCLQSRINMNAQFAREFLETDPLENK